MDANQQTALEGLVGRALTPEQVAELSPHVAIRNDVAIAEILSRDRTRLERTYIGSGTIMAKMNGLGGVFLDTLVTVGEQNRDAYWAMDLIKQGRFDLGEPASQDQLTAMAASMPTFAEGLSTLKAMAHAPNPLNFNQVSDALNIAEGRMTL